jgi:hypothetical protein
MLTNTRRNALFRTVTPQVTPQQTLGKRKSTDVAIGEKKYNKALPEETSDMGIVTGDEGDGNETEDEATQPDDAMNFVTPIKTPGVQETSSVVSPSSNDIEIYINYRVNYTYGTNEEPIDFMKSVINEMIHTFFEGIPPDYLNTYLSH